MVGIMEDLTKIRCIPLLGSAATSVITRPSQSLRPYHGIATSMAAATWEEQEQEQEPEAPSPSIFLNLPPTPDGGDDGDPASSQPHDDLALDYISRMLMEEDIVDKFLYQYPNHPALLQAQQPFAQILSDTTTTTIASALSTTSSDALAALPQSSPDMLSSALLSGQGNNTGSAQDPAFFLNGTGAVEPSSSLFPAGENTTSMGMLSSLAFFKGMEEAKRFLPRDHEAADGRGRKNRLGGELDDETEADVGRSSKQLAALVQPDSEEETAAREMLDQIMLDGYEMCLNEMQELHVSMEREKEAEKEKEAEQQSICRKAPRGRRGARQAVTDLHSLLIRCAEADRRGAGELLEQIKRHSSPTGDATQRLAHCFAEGLEARLAGTGSRLYQSLMAKRTSMVMILKAYQLYMAACCFLKVAFLFSNKTIYNAVAGRQKLHIVHYGINHGFQWPDLLRWLADREGGPPEVRITGIDAPQPGFRPAEQIEEAGRRLSLCARQFGVPLKFRAIAAKSEVVRAEDLDIDPDEVLVVNSVFHFRTLMDESVVVDRPSPRDLVLGTIRKMKPAVFVHAIANGSYSTPFFVTRFREALYDFTARFDMMDATVPRDNHKRLLVERDIFAPCAMNIVACEGADRVERQQNYRQWQAQNQRAGLRQLPLDPDIVEMLRETVRKQYHKNFFINEDHRWLLQGWKGRVLHALSTWTYSS